MSTTWKHEDISPIIARVINAAYARTGSFVTHDEIASGLLADGEAARIIEEAQAQQDEQRPREWLAHNMVAWFSERITVGQSEWEEAFERTKIDGKWAYRPRQENPISGQDSPENE